MDPFIRYLTTWYADGDPARRAEMLEAVRRQVADPLVLSATVWLDPSVGDQDVLDLQGMAHERRPWRPTFADLCASATDPTAVYLMTNTDCFVDPTCTPRLATIEKGEVWCLSREDNMQPVSQDAWVWRGRLPVAGARYPFGVPGCDNRFAYECAMSGRRVRNPALDIIVRHLHGSGRRRWTDRDRLMPPYLFVKPTRIVEAPEYEFRGSPEARARFEAAQQEDRP